ncbi:MAG: hypothetical protein AAFU78_19725, partial [Cyanobacteria bacterium J06633_2]
MANIRGNDGANILQGTRFSDTLFGFGDDDTLIGYQGDDYLFGGEDDDTLEGGDFNDTDRLIGGNGDDTYIIRDERDIIIETSTGGIDHVFSTVNFENMAHWKDNDGGVETKEFKMKRRIKDLFWLILNEFISRSIAAK